MKHTMAVIALLAMAGGACAAVGVGQPAPDFTAKDISGNTIQLSQYRGKIVVLESFNQDCPFCHNQYKTGAMQQLQRDMAAKGVVWLLVDSVNPNNPGHRTPAQARKEQADLHMTITAWIDDSSGALGHLYGMKTTPHMFVIDKNGVLVYDGAIDNKPTPNHDPRQARNYVRAAVENLLAGQKVEISETRPYGCSVKYAD